MTQGSDSVDPLRSLLDSVCSRLAALEASVGISTPAADQPPTKSPAPVSPTKSVAADNDSPAILAYDAHVQKVVKPMADSCDALEGMKNMGDLLQEAWAGVRTIVVVASFAKQPSDIPGELQPHLAPLQKTLGDIRGLRLDRKYDNHCKAIMEMLGALSWIMIRPPSSTPVGFVKEANNSALFWTNKIRKEYKGKDDKHITFCDAMKDTLLDLVAYITEHHKTGLTFKPRGVSMAEAALLAQATAEAKEVPAEKAPLSPGRRSSSVRGGSGGMNSLMGELAKKRTQDGSSAATGLKHVTRDQQTWRKEFKKTGNAAPVAPKIPTMTKKEEPKKKLTGLPICEYQDRGHKWVVENQTKETADGIITIEVTDPKQQVYIYNCEGITVQVKGGKCKSVIVDTCKKSNAVFESLISGCEVVNCKKIQVQSTGICPTVSVDKTDGFLMYVCKESLATTSFVTCTSTEMNVSFPDENGEQKELPIPEQFVHKLVDGAVQSSVSDLYH
mmetsp:Transcript_8385/g.12862  ORF Transcript_8385/g.12862 Transcript_8385/m.12862 type:complete len:501 (+) Transcript_8385:81-1583(+)|eukprot:CAMPEP_0195287098 /NCGR_PEP_ID=MMETSP0707-20130614/4306_1 /TAXON_ID=33640 /ORGANISM="Asterionellopsis glacialis, Strain CCMP134" /LENGTH=500 /DNA_ID=CAMNT_0040346825 /DNA_START=35 /DNA_END=1537 /DNA_ORIENTATION=+